MGFQGSRIVADTTAYSRVVVEAFSDGEQSYHKLHRNTFGPLIAGGKVNVYSTTNAIKYGYPEHAGRLSKLYVQSGNHGHIEAVNYGNLRKMIHESPSLLQFRRTRSVIEAAIATGVCGFVAGAITSGNATMKSDNARAEKGVTLMFGSMGILATTAVSLHINRIKLRKAISIYNLSP